MNLLITGAWQGAKENIDQIKKMGHEVPFCQYEKYDLPCDYEWVEGVICNGLFCYHPIEKFCNLKYVQLTSAGFDRVPMDYIENHNIKINNARGVYSIPMAEYAVCGVLEIYKNMAYFRKMQQEHRWEKHRGLMELYGKTVCIVGCGSVGTECAKRFRTFGCKVIGVATSERKQEFFDNISSTDSLDELLPRVDVIILTVPLTKTTHNLIDKRRLDLLKHNSIIVNISRGKVIEQKELEKVLINGKISAVLDVFDEEPLDKNNVLWDLEDVIVTPHNSFIGEKNPERLKKLIMDHLTCCI